MCVVHVLVSFQYYSISGLNSCSRHEIEHASVYHYLLYVATCIQLGNCTILWLRLRYLKFVAGTALIVAGGIAKNGSTMKTVEVMDTEILQWFAAVELPQPLWGPPAVVCGDQIYILSLRNSTMKTVEVMDTEILQWFAAVELPQPLWGPPAVVCGDQIYILSLRNGSKSMYTC